MRTHLFFIALLGFCSRIDSQNDAQMLRNLASSDSIPARIVFEYPDSIRNAVLTAATYPQGFARLEELQRATSGSFSKAISSYSQNKQEQLWDIVRYPELTGLLVANKDKSRRELKALLKTYPRQTRKAAIRFEKYNPGLIAQLNKIQTEFEKDYLTIVQEFPPQVGHSYDVLLRHPELLSVFSKDMYTTVALGDLYKRNPNLIKDVMDSVYRENSKREGQRIQVGTSVRKKHPKKYDVFRDDIYTTEKDSELVNPSDGRDYVRPYPYWAGYPLWFGFDFWYPDPWFYGPGMWGYPGGWIGGGIRGGGGFGGRRR